MKRSTLGAVLAGGSSRRMGRDKALAPVRGASTGGDPVAVSSVMGGTLAGRAIAGLGAVFDEVVLVAPFRKGYERLEAEIVPDLIRDRGPLGGLHAALTKADGRQVFLLACDLPNVSPDLVRFIHDRSRSEPGGEAPESARAWVAELGGRLQPLCGVYTGGCLPVVEKALREDRLGMHDLLHRLDTVQVSLTPESSFFRDDILLNVNRPEDFEALHLRKTDGRK